MEAQNKLFLWLGGAVLLCAAALLFYRLGAEPFQDYDEATYAEITSESLAQGNYLSLTFLHNPYFRKPPLLFWLTSASREVIPDEEFAMRLPGALAALGTIALVMLICFEASGSIPVAVLGGAILTTTAAFMEPARHVRFDLLVTFFAVAAFYAGMRAKRDTRWYVAAGVMLGLAVLAKGIIVGFALVALLIYSWKDRFSFLRRRWFWHGALAFLLVALPWHIYETMRFGSAFWQSYFGNEVLARVQTNLFAGTNAPSNLGYAWYLLAFAAPWSALFLAMIIALPFLHKRMDARVRPAFRACFGTVLSVLAVMAISHTKAVSYLIPLYPFMAAALALFAFGIYRSLQPDRRALCAGILLLCIPAGLALTACNAFHLNSYYWYQDELAQEEKAIGRAIRAHADAPAVYEYQDTDIGSIQYYGRIPTMRNTFVLLLSEDSAVEPGSLVVTAVSSTTLAHQFPKYQFAPLYTGADVSLFRTD